MKLSRIAFSGLVSLLAVQPLQASPIPVATSFEKTEREIGQSEHNEKNLLSYLWPVLQEAGEAGRIYYRGVCSHGTSPWVAFPQVDAEEAATGKKGFDAVRDVFRNDPRVEVSKDPAGIVRVKIGHFPDSILRTKIAALNLSPLGQYNAKLSLLDIDHVPEVQGAMHRLGIEIPPPLPINMIVVQPDERYVHVPALMRDITMDQALDVVAATFKGIVLYGACTRPRRYDLDFSGGIYFDNNSLNR